MSVTEQCQPLVHSKSGAEADVVQANARNARVFVDCASKLRTVLAEIQECNKKGPQ